MKLPRIGTLLTFGVFLIYGKAALADIRPIDAIEEPSGTGEPLAYETTDRGQLFEDASAEDGYGDIANILTWMDDPSNDHRQIGGWLDEETGREGFHDTGDTFATLTDPRAGGATVIVRINRRGRIVDSYERGLDHGWPAPRHVAEALEPNASPLLAGFLAALAMVLRRNSRSTRHPACVKGE